ncbi:4Fe-4S binding protein [Agathobaculum sp. Marseille-P7918]|uniref:4Fe-4S binding protein n=1 Tax=Agathobaculum sp. Marseille-P7918 TaxID=2479843 RepID=UPI000F6409B8|nr:4Fe-4S binding protein [Agathobaculum sp. Marseille-P7918]
MGKLRKHLRTLVQLVFAALTNGYAAGFAKGSIYKGAGKLVCVPGLNCYSCPGALGSCPIGSFQAVITSRTNKFTFYVIGFFLLFGALFGRLVCGWLCPFGLVQDLLDKIPFPKKLRRLPGDRVLKYLKYVILVGFVIVLPLTVLDIVGQGQPWFCKYICPSGTLFAGIPLIASNPPLRAALGWLFTWKTAILAALLLLSIVVYRPFCRYLCPLGAIYGLFNPVALYRFRIDAEKCTQCGACQRACKLDIPVWQTPNSPECIRCGDCRRACPHGAVCTVNPVPQHHKSNT